jgi:BirA family biotin operon repressor/biotin-[acetyl-CoA-carboxylase] ligase
MSNIPILPAGFNLIFYDSIGSTNEVLKQKAITDNAADCLVIWAREQTSGRGRMKRTWVSKPGNMHCSVLFRPDYSLTEASQISFLTVVAAREALASLLDNAVSFSYKWPNDLLLNKKKVGGILIESSAARQDNDAWIIIGCGLNLQYFPSATLFPATSIVEELGEVLDVRLVVEAFLKCLAKWYIRWRDQGFKPIRDAWLVSAHVVGEKLSITYGSEKITGSFKDLDDHGMLVLETRNGMRRISAGDIDFNSVNGVL